LTRILTAVAAGTPTVVDIARQTGLDESMVRLGIDELVRMGRLQASQLAAGCPPAGCGGCASGRSDEAGRVAPGCGADAPSEVRRGPVLVALSVPQRRD
jgi:hypothetical protein